MENGTTYDFSGSSQDYYIADQELWDDTFNQTFDTTTESLDNPSYWSQAWGVANTPVGTGIIGGAAQGYAAYQSQQSADDRHNSTMDYNATKDDKYFALQEEQLALQREQLALQKAIQDDKENTRKRHNKSINAKSGGSKKVSFG